MSRQTDTLPVIVVGGGAGGLSCAALLARAGHNVTLLEAGDALGGKLRQDTVQSRSLDAGPTVLTMRWVFERLFSDLGTRFDEHVSLSPAHVLARHFWQDGSRLDLFADVEETAAHVAAFAGGHEAEGYLHFCKRAGQVLDALDETFLQAQKPATPIHLALRFGWRRLPQLAGISPFSTLWGALGTYFRDPRLRQLFGRYATYCGSSPFLAPATLMLVAAVEQRGVWLVEGDMAQVGRAIAAQAARLGVEIRTRSPVREILADGGRVRGVLLESGEVLRAKAAVFNGDVQALASGLLGPSVAHPRPRAAPSLSAVTWSAVLDPGEARLQRHNVFFSADTRLEFDELFSRRALPSDPTIYICAEDRQDEGHAHAGPERLFCLANAPAGWQDDEDALEALQATAERTLRAAGVTLSLGRPGVARRTPAAFASLYPGTGGALYGAASHGWQSTFRRPGARTVIAGLFGAGGSAHPGPGLPMAVLSGRLAAAALLEDFPP